MNDKPLLPTPIPWYRTRLFWGVILISAFVGDFVLFSHLLKFSESIPDLIFNATIILGAGSLWVPLFGIFGTSQLISIGSLLLYTLTLFWLLYKTFHNYKVNILYPLIITGNLIVNATLIYVVLSSI